MSRPTIIATPALFIGRRTRYRVRKLWGKWWAEEWLILESRYSPSWSRTEAMLSAEDCGRGLSGWRRAFQLAHEKAGAPPVEGPAFGETWLDKANAATKAPRVEPPC